jgi:hypothetical protein
MSRMTEGETLEISMKPDWTYWVIPERLLGGPHPAAAASLESLFAGTLPEPWRTDSGAAGALESLLAAGIQSFLDLTHPGEKPPYEGLLPAGIRYRRMAINDFGVPQSADEMTRILAHIRHELDAGRPLYVHCHAGIGRTGTVHGCWLAEAGFVGEEALTELNRLWQHSQVSGLWSRIPQNPTQVDYIRRWRV